MNIQSIKNNKKLKLIIGALISIMVLLFLVFGIYTYLDNKAQDQASEINPLLSGTSFLNCESVVLGDVDSMKSNKYINSTKLVKFTQTCEKKYSLQNISKDENNCRNIISSNTSKDLRNDYIFVDGYDEIKKECNTKFQEIIFSTGSFFDVEDDFKSSINLDFIVPFFTDLEDGDSEEFIQNRIDAKRRLIDSLKISNDVKIQVEDVVLYPNSATIYLNLEPLKEYTIKSNEASIRGDRISKKDSSGNIINKNSKMVFKKSESFIFTTPEKKYLGIKLLDPVSLYMESKGPKFQLLDYDSGKNKVSVKICRIDEENYYKIDLLKGRVLTEENKDFFINGIDKLKTVYCNKKEITLREEGQTDKFIKKDFDFKKEIGGEFYKNGLFYVTFDNYIDREFNSRVQKPILFGIVGSHITMKLSRNGEAFFLVTDFEGKPLSGQNIRIYLNDFKGKNKTWNRKNGEYNEKYYSPLDKNVLSKEILVGQTKEDGILKINLKDKVPEYFNRTLNDDYDFDWTGVYSSFFIKSSSPNYLSYNSSRWNSGIAPWNFGYRVGGYWDDSKSDDDIVLNRWGNIEPDYYSHTYTDRVLYLPGEEVNFKSIIRKSSDLSVEKNKSFTVKIKDSNAKEIYSKNLKINDFGSLFDSFSLKKDSPLGYYTVILNDGDKQIGTTTFSVEVFKNPKFKTDVSLSSFGLEAGNVKIDDVKKLNYWRDEYSGKFSLKANIISKYYNGSSLTNAGFTYKVYKQEYYENSWWDNCFYGCYWEPEKEFYTSGEGKLDENGVANIDLGVDFKSSYDDYKYIFEVSVTDISGDTISSSNSLVVKLPDEYKKWNNNFDLKLKTENKFYKVGENLKIIGNLSGGKWTKYFDDKYILIVKKKEYKTKTVKDVRGYNRSVNKTEEKLVDIISINSNNFKVNNDGSIVLDYKLKDSGEYVFNYGKVDSNLDFLDQDGLKKALKQFQKTKENQVEIDRKYTKRIQERVGSELTNPCKGIKNCSFEIETIKNHGKYNTGRVFILTEIKKEDLDIDDLLDYNSSYFTILGYSDSDAKNPALNDNKLHVFSEKNVYKLGEKARVLVRLPFSKGKILWTVEKAGVVKNEYIDVNSNVFFKEFVVDDSFVPNAYIGVTALEVDNTKLPEYKVGYTEIVVDKTDKKSIINIKTNKKTYNTKEEVTIDLDVQDISGNPKSSELTVMVIDDSLISLMGNIDLNTLEKFYKKLPFQIQTSLTNLSMLKNYYFARPGIVGGSGFGNFKGGDSAVSTRNIFKNTAYYNPSVITDSNGKAQVKFILPDNLTNFRIIALSNSKDNFFGYSQEFIEVRQNVLIEPKTPIIIRSGDEVEIGANIFNNTSKSIGFKVSLKTDYLAVETEEKNVEIASGKSRFVYFKVKNDNNKDTINYTISALGDTAENSDKYEGTIQIKQAPILIQNQFKTLALSESEVKESDFKIGDNTDISKSSVEVVFSNNRLSGIEKIVNSLAVYPYGCIEQTVSSTLPNAILKKFSTVFKNLSFDREKIDTNISYGLDRIKSMQLADGGFTYWQGGSSSDLHITPYVLRSLIDMKDIGAYVDDSMIKKATVYLENNLKDSNISKLEKTEILWTLAKTKSSYYSKINLSNILKVDNLSRHSLIALSYAMVLTDKDKYKNQIKQNIEKIKPMLEVSDGYWYWNNISDKAIFASLLIDYDYDLNYIDEIILNLYNNDWESYYYSTQTKNNAFMAFSKYIEKYGKDNKSKFGFMLGKVRNPEKVFWIGRVVPNVKKFSYKLSEVADDNETFLRVANIEGANMYADLTLKEYPKDVEKIKSTSNGVKVKRDIYEISDNSKLDVCEKAQNSYYNKGKDTSNLTECKGIYTLHSGLEFAKGKTYKAKITIEFPDSKTRRNVSLEDYLPSSFRVLNNKFKTESISVSENTSTGWNWDHVEFKPDVVFANSSRSYGKTLEFEYFFIPEFSGTFIQPPVTTYMMYNPQVRANSKFRRIVVK